MSKTTEQEARQIWEVNQTEMAGFFGVTTVTLRSWGLKPIRRVGRMAIYDLRKAVAERYAESESLDLSTERAKLARSQREKIELELGVRAGELLEISLVVRAWSAVLTAFRSRVERAVAAIETAAGSGELDPVTGARLAGELRGSLDDLASLDVLATMPDQVDDDGAGNGTDSAADINSGLGGPSPDGQSRGLS